MGSKGDRIVFQKDRTLRRNVYEIPYYNMLRRYLSFLGQNPYQERGISRIIVTIMVFSVASIFLPTFLELYVSLCERDMDAVIECLPHLIATATGVVKILNVYFYRENFKKLFDFIRQEWEWLKLKNELHVLEEITAKGSKVAHLYRTTLLSFLVVFLVGPLLFPIMDIINPLNETRPRQQALRVNYLVFDVDEYFFYVYLHLAWGAFVTVMIVVTVDSLYIVVIHCNSGLFAVCGHRITKVTQNKGVLLDANSDSFVYEQIKTCVIMHSKAIEFYNILNQSSRNSYLLQVGLNMMGISVTAVQTVLNLNRPEEAIRTGIFLGGEQFHLFVISLPGQVLLDHCLDLKDNIYCSTWYKVPIKVQKMIHIMQIRSKTPCTLSAGGLYEMNIENFGVTFKTCMSYVTMLMSLRE